MFTESDPQSFDFDTVVPRGGTASLKWERYAERDVLPFWVADMDFEVAPAIQRALRERVEHAVYGYTVPPDGMADAVMAYLAREFDWTIDADALVWLPGVVPGLAASCRAFCESGSEVIVNPPIYHHFFDSHEEARQRLVEVPLAWQGERRVWDIDATAAACTEATRLIMLCSPHNPTGTVFTTDELKAMGRLCQERGLIVVSDEIHCDLVLDRNARHVPLAVACPELSGQLITLMSGSKTYNIAGLNCSFAVIEDAHLRESFKRGCRGLVPMVAPFAYAATHAAYAEGGEWRRQLLDYLRGNLDLIARRVATIPGLELRPLEATYLAWIDATALGLDDAQAFFEEHGVGLSAGEQFGQAGHLRFNFACARSIVSEGLDRMARAVATLPLSETSGETADEPAQSAAS